MKYQCTDPLQSIWRKQLAPYLPEPVNMALQHLPQGMVPEEIRLRAGQPMQICFSDGDRLIGPKQGCSLIMAEDCAEVLRRITDNSLYAWADELRQGFLTLAGGYRVGMLEGNLDDGFLSVNTGVDIIKDIPTVEELITRLFED